MANIDQRPLDENYLAHGEWIGYWDNGNIDYRCNFAHGILHGLHEGYNSNDTLRHRGHMNMGREIGYWYYDYQPKSYYLCVI